MKKFILATKQGMSQIFNENNEVVPATLIKAGPIVVIQKKTKDTDGYEAIQVGFGNRNSNNIKKPQLGHLKKAEADSVRWMREFKVKGKELEDYNIGDKLGLSVFAEGDQVKVAGVSKGKGFQGAVKRHGFHGGPRSHGQKHSEREVGSIGSTGPQRVFKGKKMPGRMGGDRITVKNLKVVKIDKENNLMAISGAVPGRKGALLQITSC